MKHISFAKASSRRAISRITCLAAVIFASTVLAHGQVDDFCTEFGATPSLNSPFANIPYVYGRITYKGASEKNKLPRLNVILIDGDQTNKRITVGSTGNYCFRRAGGSATLIVEVDGIEAARRSMPSFGATQQREDFEIASGRSGQPPPAIISARFSYPPNAKTIDLYKRASTCETAGKKDELIATLRDIVAADAADFIAWAKLGSLHLEKRSYADAEAALRRSIELKLEYTPAWINFGQVRLGLKQYEAAIEVLKHAVSLDNSSARAYQLLGEAYLLAKLGSLGAEALNQAIKLDPIGMAECHLQLAHLYQLANARSMASKEYRLFLEKVPDHPERSKFEKFIRENP
jgi:Flp pilus assembly protein TadD